MAVEEEKEGGRKKRRQRRKQKRKRQEEEEVVEEQEEKGRGRSGGNGGRGEETRTEQAVALHWVVCSGGSRDATCFFSYGQTTRLLVMGEVHIPAHCRLVHAIRFILLWRNGIPWAEKCYGWIRT